jgi:hypothetical protein
MLRRLDGLEGFGAFFGSPWFGLPSSDSTQAGITGEHGLDKCHIGGVYPRTVLVHACTNCLADSVDVLSG